VTSYREAGVDLQGASDHVRRISDDVTSTWTEAVVGGFGGFAAGIRIPSGYINPVLMMSTDGVGTKLELARRTGIWGGVGNDLVAMCVDDLAAVGAEPVGFVDYMAVGSLRPERDHAIVRSIADACVEASCALLGGETAEHPGVMDSDAVDLAGAAAGVVEDGLQLSPDNVDIGDVIVGLRSPNLRSNGFSLVRSVFGDEVEQHAAALLSPSVIYSPAVIAAIRTGNVHSAAHITGGGIVENLVRALPTGAGAEIETKRWKPAPVFDLVQQRGVPRDEMFSTFNMGIGFCLVVPADHAPEICDIVSNHGPEVIGEVVSGGSVVID